MSSPESMLDDLEKEHALSGTLSKWEEEFVASLRERLDMGLELTPKQEEKLKEIHSDTILNPRRRR